MSMIDQIIDFNKSFVEQKGYEKYLTDKYPNKRGTRDTTRMVEKVPFLNVEEDTGIIELFDYLGTQN